MAQLDVNIRHVTNRTYCTAVYSMLCHKRLHISMSNQWKLPAVLLSVTAVYLHWLQKLLFFKTTFLLHKPSKY